MFKLNAGLYVNRQQRLHRKGKLMKTLQRANEVIRATEEQVETFLRDGWEFCPKSQWKEMQACREKAVVSKKVKKKK
jgi:hypothetical protein